MNSKAEKCALQHLCVELLLSNVRQRVHVVDPLLDNFWGTSLFAVFIISHPNGKRCDSVLEDPARHMYGAAWLDPMAPMKTEEAGGRSSGRKHAASARTHGGRCTENTHGKCWWHARQLLFGQGMPTVNGRAIVGWVGTPREWHRQQTAAENNPLHMEVQGTLRTKLGR